MDRVDTQPSIELLVIGYGNTLRGDDSVGPRVAEAIEALKLPGVSVVSCTLLTPELGETISQAKRVVFVDAAVTTASEVELHQVLPAKSSQVFAHAASPATLLAIARDIFAHLPEAWCLAIPVENMEMGEELSALAKRGMDVAVQRIEQMMR